jgi:hypothetical protein
LVKKENPPMSFSSGPPRYLVNCGGRPRQSAPTLERAHEIARELAAAGSEGLITIYEIETGIHFNVQTGAPAVTKGK